MAVKEGSVGLKQELRQELADSLAEFHSTVKKLSDDQWSLRSGNSKWTMGGQLVHIGIGLGTVPLRIESARKDKAIQSMPPFVFHFLNTRLTRKLERQHDLRSVGNYVNQQFAAAIDVLDGIRDAEWDLVSRTFIQRWTVRQVFENQAKHIREHLGHVKAALADH